jgi:L-lactate dehydrogenase
MPRPGEPRAAALIAGEIDSSTRNGACTIVRGKGSTYYGIGAGIARIVAAIRQDEQAVLWFSTAKAEVEGVRDVALSMPRLVGREGVTGELFPDLDAEEHAALHRSAAMLRGLFDSVPL